jgi:hypothetical protein
MEKESTKSLLPIPQVYQEFLPGSRNERFGRRVTIRTNDHYRSLQLAHIMEIQIRVLKEQGGLLS